MYQKGSLMVIFCLKRPFSATVRNTRGSNFWSSKVCEGGESREAYACRLTFGPPQCLFEINDHVTETHFWLNFKLIENSRRSSSSN